MFIETYFAKHILSIFKFCTMLRTFELKFLLPELVAYKTQLISKYHFYKMMITHQHMCLFGRKTPNSMSSNSSGNFFGKTYCH